jgi:hypothetical protein
MMSETCSMHRVQINARGTPVKTHKGVSQRMLQKYMI